MRLTYPPYGVDEPGAFPAPDGTITDYRRGDHTWANLQSAVLGTSLTGFVAAPGVITAADTVLDAIEKLAAGAGFDQADADLLYASLSHSHAYSSLSGIPSTFAPAAHTHSYGSLTGIPSTFAPSSHTHPQSEITNLATDLAAKATTAGTLAQFSSTTSAQLASIISDKTGTGSLVFATSPTLVTPVIGTATGTSLTLNTNLNLSGGSNQTFTFAPTSGPTRFFGRAIVSEYAQFGFQNAAQSQRGFIGYVGASFTDVNRQDHFEIGSISGTSIYLRPGDSANEFTFATAGVVTGGASGLTFNSGGTNQNVNVNPSGTGVVQIPNGSGYNGKYTTGTTTNLISTYTDNVTYVGPYSDRNNAGGGELTVIRAGRNSNAATDAILFTGSTKAVSLPGALAITGALTGVTSVATSGTISANNVGANIRVRADGTNALDGGVWATAPGVIYFANFNADRGFSVAADGNINVLGTDKIINQSTWTSVTFDTGWTDFGGTYRTVQYRKDKFGRVWLRGVAKRTSGTTTAIFTLPTGFRPTVAELHGTVSDATRGEIEISTAGVVSMTIGNPGYITMSSISFTTD